jgi:hypothetical protein
VTHRNEFQASGTSPSNGPDFTIRDEGSILLLTPHTEAARAWVSEHIGADNGYQPYWPTVLLEPRYFEPIYQGLTRSGLSVR